MKKAQKIPLSGFYNEACSAKKKKTTTDSDLRQYFVYKMSDRPTVAEGIGMTMLLTQSPLINLSLHAVISSALRLIFAPTLVT